MTAFYIPPSLFDPVTDRGPPPPWLAPLLLLLLCFAVSLAALSLATFGL